MLLSLIAAIATNNAIGVNNQLLCRLPNDMKRFKQLTAGHTVIMGRKTFDSLPGGALPNRTNVVITRSTGASFTGCETYGQLSTAINNHQHENEIFIIGGASIYEQAIALADKLYLTFIHHTFEQADTFFPVINESEWALIDSENHPADERHLHPYTFATFIKKKKST